jgi:hypothetical protein
VKWVLKAEDSRQWSGHCPVIMALGPEDMALGSEDILCISSVFVFFVRSRLCTCILN